VANSFTTAEVASWPAGRTWDPGATEFIGGLKVGYNWQFGHLLVGVEGTFDLATGIKDFSWGLGPIVTVPTASNLILGTGKVLLGPEAVIIYTRGHWVIGAMISNSWLDPLRDSVNLFYTQAFINYNIPHGQGWYLVSTPIITTDWNAPPSTRWTVPLGARDRPPGAVRTHPRGFRRGGLTLAAPRTSNRRTCPYRATDYAGVPLHVPPHP